MFIRNIATTTSLIYASSLLNFVCETFAKKKSINQPTIRVRRIQFFTFLFSFFIFDVPFLSFRSKIISFFNQSMHITNTHYRIIYVYVGGCVCLYRSFFLSLIINIRIFIFFFFFCMISSDDVFVSILIFLTFPPPPQHKNLFTISRVCGFSFLFAF